MSEPISSPNVTYSNVPIAEKKALKETVAWKLFSTILPLLKGWESYSSSLTVREGIFYTLIGNPICEKKPKRLKEVLTISRAILQKQPVTSCSGWLPSEFKRLDVVLRNEALLDEPLKSFMCLNACCSTHP